MPIRSSCGRAVVALVAVGMVAVSGIGELEAQGRRRQLVLENPTVWVDGNRTDILGRIGAVFPLPSGGLVIGDADSYRILFFRTPGSTPTIFGRKGQGPGEFEQPIGVSHVGDSLLVGLDFIGKRAVFFNVRTGKLVTEYRLPSFLGKRDNRGRTLGAGTSEFMMAITSLSTALISSDTDVEAARGGEERNYLPTPMFHVNMDGTVLRAVGATPGPGCNGSRWLLTGAAPKCTIHGTRITSDGLSFVVVSPSQAWPRDSSLLVTRVSTVTGDTMYSVRVPVQRTRIPSAVRDSLSRRMAERGRNIQIPEFEPPFPIGGPGLLAGSGGYTMVVLSRAVSSPVRKAVIIGGNGAVVGELDLPSNFVPKSFGTNYIFGVLSDENDVQSVVQYRYR